MQLGRMTPLLNVENVSRSLDFYVEKVGFNVMAVYPEDGPPYWARLRYGDAELMLNQPDGADSAARRDSPSYTQMMLFFDVPDVEVARRALLFNGVAPGPISEEAYGKEFTLRDPDGYELAFVGS